MVQWGRQDLVVPFLGLLPGECGLLPRVRLPDGFRGGISGKCSVCQAEAGEAG